MTLVMKLFFFGLYRGNAIGQVVLAGDTQKFVLRELISTERTRSRFLLHL